MSGFKEAEEAAAFVRGRSKLRPVLGLVLGSGLGAFADSLKGATHIPFAEIPHFPTSTAIGHRGELVLGVAADTPVAVMNGRVHFYEGYSPAQVVFPVRVLGRLGIKTVVMTNAAGSVNVNYKTGELMIITDHINYMGINPLVGLNDGTSSFTIPQRPIRRRLPDVPPFVVTRGGEYCFAPGLRALRWLAEPEA